jgi:polar amino acid transport system permease protein
MSSHVIEELPRFFGYYNDIFLLKALLTTFLLSAGGCLIGSVAGFCLAILRRTTSHLLLPLRLLAIVFVEMFRRIPYLVTLLLAFFAFHASGFDLSVFDVGLVSVCLIATAFISEIIRGGLDSVHQNQWDAAATMNLSMPLTLIHVIVPQAWRVILPPVFSFFILFIKDTALASQIGVVELTYSGKVLNDKGFPAALAFGTILLLYFVLSYPLTRIGAWMEAKLAPARNHRP